MQHRPNFAVLVVPMLAVLLLSVVQLLSHALFSCGTVFYMLAVIWPLYRSLSLTKVYTSSSELRRTTYVFTKQHKIILTMLKLISAACFVGYLVMLVLSDGSLPQLKTLLQDALEGSALALSKLVFSSICNFLLTTVLVADMLLTAIISTRLSEGKTLELAEADQQVLQAAIEAHSRFRASVHQQHLQQEHDSGWGDVAQVTNPMKDSDTAEDTSERLHL